MHGVVRGHAFRTLAGAGRVFGVAFRPGCFRPLLGRAVSTLTDRTVAARELWGPGVPQRAVDAAADQAHLARDFAAIAGESPTAYAQRYPR